MGITTFHRGHKVYALQDSNGVYSDWRYMDGTPIKKEERNCLRCKSPHDFKDHDHCIANLPGVKYACCGHGAENGYVKLYSGKVITFNTNCNREKIIELIKLYE